MENQKTIGVIGGGSWATAIVKMLQHNCEKINWFIRRQETIDYIKQHKHNPNYLSSVSIDTRLIEFYNDISDCISQSDILIVSIPAQFIEETFVKYHGDYTKKLVFSAVKGIVPKHNLTITEFFNKFYNIPFSKLGIISGPCHAEEIALERLSYLTVSSKNKADAQYISDKIDCHYVNPQISTDIYGTEYAAILKNIVAIAAGICNGLGYGDNFQAVLVSNAIQEIKRFLDKTYKSKRKINTSPYLGDLLVTSYSQFSRNRTFGTMIGKGYSVRNAQLEMNMVAEGINAVACIKQINDTDNVKMPIMEAVYNIVINKVSPLIEIRLLTEKLK